MMERGQPLMILNDQVLVGNKQFQQLHLETTIAKKYFFLSKIQIFEFESSRLLPVIYSRRTEKRSLQITPASYN
jgi:hypothetical protein